MVNDKKICFIACVNNERLWKECLVYIDRLIIPEGYKVDVLAVWDAKSIAAGYNEGMQASDAKYKIYLHQDVFITDLYFLQELIDIFAVNKSIGMVGLVGVNHMPKDGIMWHGDRVFSIYCKYNLNIDGCREYTKPTGDNIAVVEAIDGLLIATQYDLPWREDIFDGWDFYDASQSAEFKKRGYEIVVPQLNKPICVHDDGYILNLSRYEEYRQRYINEYR